MLRRALLPALTLTLALTGVVGEAWAGGRGGPQQFEAREIPEEELARQRARAKNRLHSFSEAEDAPEETSFPWMALGLGVTAFLVAAPFALIAYRQLVRDLRATEAAHAPMPAQPARRTKPPNPHPR